jgi:hypothetical protein
MFTRVLAATVTSALVTGALAFGPAAAAGAAASPVQDFESFASGSPVQGGWGALDQAGYDAAGFDEQIADTTGLFAGALGAKSLRISNAVTSGAFGNQLFSPSVADEAGEASAESAGLSGGARKSRFTSSFTFASADPTAEQPGLMLGISPDRGDGARMGLIRLYDTPTGLKVTAYGYDSTLADFVETTVASGLDRTAVHQVSLTLDLLDGVSNDRLSVVVDGHAAVVATSWEQYFREVEHNPTRTADSLLLRVSGVAQPALAGKGFFLDAISTGTTTTPAPVTVAKSLDEVALAAHVDGWASVPEDWNGAADGTANGATGAFVAGPAGADGAGSYQIDLGAPVGANNGKLYFGRAMTDVALADLTGLSYRVFTPTTNATADQPYVNLTVAGGGKTYSNLVFEPNEPASNPNAASITKGGWTTIDAFAPGARWRATNTLAGQPTFTYHTLGEWLALAPDLRTHGTVGGIFLVAGASGLTPAWSGYRAAIDEFDVTLAGTTTAYAIDNPAPNPVDGLVSSNVTSTGFDLSWATAPHAVAYDVKVGNVLTSQTGTTASITGLPSSTSVLVQVRARNSAGVSAWEYLLVTTVAATPAPRTTATMAVSPRTTVYGAKVLVAGVLRTNGVGTGASVVSVSVRIGTRWYSLGRATTAANGTWRLPVRATFPTATLRATAAGFPTVTTSLKVASAPAVSVRGRALRVNVAPKLTGRPVILQVRSGGAWRTVLRTLLRTGSTRTFTAPRAGTYRVVVPATNGYLAGTSAKVTVR